ncbi:MAG TPA: globin domain-containing protein [Nannocystaceae bacterium]|nr:globin domain-containing protein [Nannocystaceae bacterium]
MALDVDLLRSSFALVVEREPELTRRFYEVLFRRYPQARALFGRNAARAQEQMLRDALVAVIDHLEDPTWLGETLGALGRRHVGYGVTIEMYDWVGASLIETLADVAGDAWNDALTQAWTNAYVAIASAMQAGANAATAA